MKKLWPGRLARQLFKLVQMLTLEPVQHRQHPCGAPDLEVRPPDLRPAALDGDAALFGAAFGETVLGQLAGQGGFKPGRAGEENVKAGLGHRAFISEVRCCGDTIAPHSSTAFCRPALASPARLPYIAGLASTRAR